MDLLRSCYRDRMQGLGANGETIPVRWYFTAPDAKFLPFPTVFCSRQWDDEHPSRGPQPGPVKKRGEWVNGEGPPPGCCDTPFGDAQAFEGIRTSTTPSKGSCPWYTPNLTTILRLIARFVVISPRKYTGRIRLRLLPKFLTPNLRRYTGRVSLNLTPKFKTTSPRTYTGRIPLDLVPRFVSRVPRYYTGRVPLDLVPRFVTVSPKVYVGRVPLTVAPSFGAFRPRFYAWTMPLTVAPSFASSAGRFYVGAVGLTLTPKFVKQSDNPLVYDCSLLPDGAYTYWTVDVEGITGSDDCTSQNGTFQLTYAGEGSCTWHSDSTWPAAGPRYRIQWDGTQWVIRALDSSGSTMATWIMPGFSGMFGTTAFLLSSSTCSGWPFILFLSPVGV